MDALSYKTRKDVSLYGIPKVFFCCHPEDFDGCFQEISDEILERQNCSVWYHGKKAVDYSQEFFDSLSQMHLFVVPVTRRFLQEGNPTLEREYRFAIDNNIPVLPLMQESGLEEKFNRLCGNLQFLDKYNQDSTCIEYSEKLDKFLDAVLLGDELIQKIRDAFDAYIFLSYRKKDRCHAQKLMQLVHQNDFCRDIAIWYDEFLVPGEDFNEAISEAMKKSNLFLLAVTPNLVNEVNYIMKVEFPMAKEQGKPILPCEMVSTDRAMLEQKYDQIPACASGNEALAQRLRNHFLDIATTERNSSPQHLYFMGLAYLNGIDVEVNREYALKLITDAAEQNLIEAIEQLINMYGNGIGVKIDGNKKIYWYKKLLSVTAQNYEQSKNIMNAAKHLEVMLFLSQVEYDMDRYDDAEERAHAIKAFCRTVCDEVYANGEYIKRSIACAELLLGRVAQARFDFAGAKDHFEQAGVLFDRLNEEFDVPEVFGDTAILNTEVALLCKTLADYPGALKHYERALELYRRCAVTLSEAHLDQALTLLRISEIKKILYDCPGAKECCLRALDILDNQIGKRSSRHYMAIKMLAINGMAEACRMSGELSEALDYYRTSARLEDVFLGLYGELIQGLRAQRLGRTAQIYFMMTDYESTIQYGTQALELLKGTGLVSDSYIATGGSETMTLNMLVGTAYRAGRNDMENAARHLKMGVHVAEDNIRVGVRCNIPDVVMLYSGYSEVLQLLGNTAEALVYTQKAVELYEEHLSGDESFRNVCSGMTLYVALGKIYILEGRLEAAISMMHKAEALHQKALMQSPDSAELLWRDTVALNYLLAYCYAEQDSSCAKEYYQKCMDRYDQVAESDYNIQDWNYVGISAYQLYSMSGRIIKSKKWKNRVLDAARQIKARFPNEYQQTFFYEALHQTGIFD